MTSNNLLPSLSLYGEATEKKRQRDTIIGHSMRCRGASTHTHTKRTLFYFPLFTFYLRHRAGCRLRNQYIGFFATALSLASEHKKLSKRARRHASHFENKFTRALPCLCFSSPSERWLVTTNGWRTRMLAVNYVANYRPPPPRNADGIDDVISSLSLSLFRSRSESISCSMPSGVQRGVKKVPPALRYIIVMPRYPSRFYCARVYKFLHVINPHSPWGSGGRKV